MEKVIQIDPKLVQLNLQASNKDEVIRGLAQLLNENGYISDLNQFIEDVYYRESLGITGIGSGVAIPHGKSAGVKQPVIAIGKVPQKIEWESYDEEPVQLIFMFAVPNTTEGSQEHLHMLAAVSSKLARTAILEKLVATTDVEEFIRIVEND